MVDVPLNWLMWFDFSYSCGMSTCYCNSLHDFLPPLLDIIRMSSVANSDQSSVIADDLGVLVGQNRCGFLKMTEHN